MNWKIDIKLDENIPDECTCSLVVREHAAWPPVETGEFGSDDNCPIHQGKKKKARFHWRNLI